MFCFPFSPYFGGFFLSIFICVFVYLFFSRFFSFILRRCRKMSNNQTIQSLNPRHFLILDMFLAGVSQKDIASKLEMTPSAISIITNSPAFQHELALRRGVIEENVNEDVSSTTQNALFELKKNASKAASVLINQMTSEDESIAQKSAMDILDRVGVAKINKTQNNSVSAIINLSPEDALLLKETLLLDVSVVKKDSVINEEK